nr:retrovirus-related Pol polyprotein from transposon TNT 1-94 [Tanacetum cinerariifolium]
VTKLATENNHLKQTYKQLYDSIKSSRVRSKEQCDDLIQKVNLKSAEVSDLNARLQEKVLMITAFKEKLDMLKGKAVITKVVSLNPIDPKLLKVDVTPVVLKLRKNRTAHIDYIRHTQGEAATLRKIVESERLLSPLNTSLDYACRYTRRIQELLVILQQTCPYLTNIGTKLETVIPKNTTKQIRQTAQVTKPVSITVTTLPSINLESNKPVISSTGVNLVSSASGSMSQDNTKNNRIRQTLKKAKKNKVKDHLRTVKSSLNKASVVDSKAILSVLNSVSNLNSYLKCASSNGCLLSDNHDTCVGAYKNSVNARKKSKYVKTPVIRKIWKTTGKVFKTVGHIWKPTGRTFTLVGNVCPLTRIATPTIVPSREPILIVNKTDKPVVTLVVQIILWYLDSGCSKHMTGDRSQLVNFVQKFLGTDKFGNDHVAKIMGYGDYQIRNVTISWVYYVEGLGHNLFSVGQFCDSDLEVAFRQHTCFICNLDGVDLLPGSRGNNLYTLSLQDMTASSPICLLSKASKTKSWLWHRRLSHLNFGAINHLARQGLVRGLPKIKFEKDHLCSACAIGKSTRKTHKPKSKDTNQEKLYLLHMDLCGPMRVESVNGKKYILVIVDDYSRFTWVKFLKSKDEASDFIIKFLKMIQVGISHETSVARSPQQNGVVERRNHTLIEAARTMLIYAQAPLFLWAEVVATACFTQNHSIIHLRHGKTPYELLHNKLPDLSFFYVFGALCYPTNDSENLGPALNEMTPGTISSGLVHTTSPSTSYVPPSRTDWDLLFQPMFDELLNPSPSVVNQVPEAIAPIVEVIPPVNVDSTGSPSSTTVEQDAPSTSNSTTPTETQPLIIPQDVGDDNLDIEVAHMGSDPMIMVTTLEQQVALDEALVPSATAKLHQHSIRFKIDIRKHVLDLEAFREMLHISPRIPGQSFAELPFKEEILEFLRLSQVQILWGLYHRSNVDYAYLIWEDFVYQVEHKNQKKSNKMYYPRFTKVIIDYFMTRKPLIPRRNKINWHYVRDDILFSTIKVVSRHQNTQQYGAILPIELTTEDIRNSKAYKEYYTCATGEAAPKPKASARKKKGGSTSSTTPPTSIATPTPTTTVVAAPRLSAVAKGKQPARATTPTEPIDIERIEAVIVLRSFNGMMKSRETQD